MLLSSPLAAAPISFWADLSGPNENPPNASPGTGIVKVTIDPVAHTLWLQAHFSGLVAPTAAAHIHCCVDAPGNAGVATQTPSFVGFPLGVTLGSYGKVFDTTLASTYRPGYLTGLGGSIAAAEAELFQGIADGRAYFNIHTTTYPGGEIRGFFEPVPEPATWLLTAAPLIAAGLFRRRARR